MAVGLRHAGDGIHAVVAEPAQKVRMVVQVERVATHLELADAEPFAPRLHDDSVLDQLDDARVEVWMLRRPGPEGWERKPKGEGERS